MKNRKLLLIVSLALAMMMSLGGTLAYLTDTDADVNTMVLGNVKITQNEQQRVEIGNADAGLEAFEQNQTMLPSVTIGNVTKEEVVVGDYTVQMRDNVKNYLDKIVTVTNSGKTDAFVRTIIAIPTGEVADSGAAADNWLHYNAADDEVYPGIGWYYGKNSDTLVELQIKDGNAPAAIWPANEIDFDIVSPVKIDDVEYKLLIATNKNILKAGETSGPSLLGIYLDSHVDMDDKGYYYEVDGERCYIKVDPNELKVLVATQAVQADGFEEAGAWYALDAAFGNITAENHPWSDGMPDVDTPSDEWPSNNPVDPDVKYVKNSEELAAAVAAGATKIMMTEGTYTMPDAAKGKTLTLTGEGADTIIEVVPAGQGEANGQLDYSLDGSTVTFNNLTIKTNSQLYAGFARLSGTYNNCTIQNTYNLGVGNSEFNNCTFNITNEYLRVGGANSAVFNGCTFNTDGRAILVFQDGTNVAQTVTVKDCTFNATAAAETWNGIHVAAVSIDGTNGTYVVNLEGTNTVDSDFNGLWQIKTGEANVTVNE